MKNGPPTRIPSPLPEAVQNTNFSSLPQDRTDRVSDRPGKGATNPANKKLAEPEYQDGRFGFDSRGDDMDVDYVDNRSNNRSDYPEQGYNSSRPERQDYGGRNFNRDPPSERRPYAFRGNNSRNGGRRPQESNRLYSDNLYSGSQGRRS
jgi:hypothetical protein